jgi:chromosome segregation ATPase
LTAVGQIESFEQELDQKSIQAERLEVELASLKARNAETAAELEKKLRAVELVNRQRIWDLGEGTGYA